MASLGTPPGLIRFGPFALDPTNRELRKRGSLVKLQPQQFAVLLLLIERAGQIVSREEIHQHIWGTETFVDFERGINFSINQIRAALGDDADKPRYVETIPRRGYRFISAIENDEPRRADASASVTPMPGEPIYIEKVLPKRGDRFIAPVSSSAEQPDQPAKAHGSNLLPTQTDVITAPVHRVATSLALLGRRRGIRFLLLAFGTLLVAVTAAVIFPRTRQRLFSPRSDAGPPSSYQIESLTTARGSVIQPAITPDGRDVAYVWNRGGGDHFDIYVQRIGSPSSMRVSYIKTGFVGYPAWSPNQTEIAFTRCDGTNDGVYIVPALGGPERRLTSTVCQDHMPTPVVWLTDSRMLMIDRCATSGLHGLAIFSKDTGEKHCIADFGTSGFNRRYSYSLSPDEKTVAFIPSIDSRSCEIYAMPVSGGSPRRVVEDVAPCESVMWTPDGGSIVFLSERRTFPSLWRVPANGGKFRPETVYPAIGSYDKDGRRFVYDEGANGEPHAVWRADLAAAGGKIVDNRKLIATQFREWDAQPSPDGTRIVWAESRAFIEELWTGSATGENPFQLTHLNSFSGTPRWSPDGKWIAFDSVTTNGSQLFVIDAEGRNLRALTTGPSQNVVPSWSRDGKSIYFSSTRTGNTEVWKHSLDTGKDIQLTIHGGANPFESYDGQTVYFSKFDEAGIWRVPSNGGKETLVLEGRPQVLYWGHWALTKSGIYFVNADAEPTARIEFFDFTTRRISPVLFLEKNVPWPHPSLSATADAKTIYYSLSDCSSVIKLMEIPR